VALAGGNLEFWDEIEMTRMADYYLEPLLIVLELIRSDSSLKPLLMKILSTTV
jgi:hypothetical protein